LRLPWASATGFITVYQVVEAGWQVGAQASSLALEHLGTYGFTVILTAFLLLAYLMLHYFSPKKTQAR
jgi:hypothetical protein